MDVRIAAEEGDQMAGAGLEGLASRTISHKGGEVLRLAYTWRGGPDSAPLDTTELARCLPASANARWRAR